MRRAAIMFSSGDFPEQKKSYPSRLARSLWINSGKTADLAGWHLDLIGPEEEEEEETRQMGRINKADIPVLLMQTDTSSNILT